MGLDHLKGAQNRLLESQGIEKFVWGFGVWVLSSLLAFFMHYTLISLFTKHFLTIHLTGTSGM